MSSAPGRYSRGRVLLFAVTAGFVLFVVYQYLEINERLFTNPGQSINFSPSQKGDPVENGQQAGRIGQSSTVKPWQALSPAQNSSNRTPDSHLMKTVVVAAQAHENTSWAAQELPADWNSVVIVVDDASAPNHTPVNKGREAGAYLWYILQNYDSLPDIIAFMHAHRDGKVEAWHVDNTQHSNPLSIRQLRVGTVLQRGFVNLRCAAKPGCPIALQPTRDPPDPDFEVEYAMPEALESMFKLGKGQQPAVIGAPCCSQFAVSKAQVLARPKAEYETYWKWLMDTKLTDAISGRIFEHLFHMIVGQKPVYCPAPQECYCANYGLWCDGPMPDGFG